MILLCRWLSREKKRYFGRFYDEDKELKFRGVGGVKNFRTFDLRLGSAKRAFFCEF